MAEEVQAVVEKEPAFSATEEGQAVAVVEEDEEKKKPDVSFVERASVADVLAVLIPMAIIATSVIQAGIVISTLEGDARYFFYILSPLVMTALCTLYLVQDYLPMSKIGLKSKAHFLLRASVSCSVAAFCFLITCFSFVYLFTADDMTTEEKVYMNALQYAFVFMMLMWIILMHIDIQGADQHFKTW